MVVANRKLTITRSGTVKVSLTCPLIETLGCHGTVTLETSAKRSSVSAAQAGAHPRLRLGRASFRIPGGQTRTVTVRISPRGRGLLRRKRRLSVLLLVTGIDTTGNRKQIVKRLNLRR